MKFKIPKSFECMGCTIKVIYDNKYCDDNGVLGEAHPNTNTIYLSDKDDGIPIPAERQIQIFLHECVHIWMSALGYDDLYGDEKFTDQLSGLINQMIKSHFIK